VSTVSVGREWDLSPIPASPQAARAAGAAPPAPSRTFTVEVGGKRLEVVLFEPEDPRTLRRPTRDRGRAGGGGTGASGDLVAPMQGTIVKTAVEPGATVAAGEVVLVLEAMKMENQIPAHRAGTVIALHVAAGDVVNAGDLLATIEA